MISLAKTDNEIDNKFVFEIRLDIHPGSIYVSIENLA